MTHSRVRRQSFIPRGRYRGQTQSQYLAIDKGNGKDEGRAEAHSAADSSRASVSKFIRMFINCLDINILEGYRGKTKNVRLKKSYILN